MQAYGNPPLEKFYPAFLVGPFGNWVCDIHQSARTSPKSLVILPNNSPKIRKAAPFNYELP